MVGYVKKDYINSKLKILFKVITVKKFEIGFVLKLPNLEENERYKVVRKLLKVIKKLKIDAVVFSKSLKEEEKVLKTMLNQEEIVENSKKKVTTSLENSDSQVTILRGKKLMEYMNLKIFEYIFHIQGKNMRQEAIYILINKEKTININFITEFIQNFKTVNIVTNDLNRFKKIQDDLYGKESILIGVSNNKKKALKKAKYILNYNLTEEQIRKYRINRNSIIVNCKETIENSLKAFEGIIVNQVEIAFSEDILEKYEPVIENDNFEKSKIYESYLLNELENSVKFENNVQYILRKNREDVKKYLERDEIQIIALNGINGKIRSEELKKISKINEQIEQKILTNYEN